MRQNLKDLYGMKLTALDGDIGHVKDFFFDAKAWVFRCLVADTGPWLAGRLVLLSPRPFGSLDRLDNSLPIKLHRKRIERSPVIETDQPITRQYEIASYRHRGWPASWRGAVTRSLFP
jgi:hypothetical protein